MVDPEKHLHLFVGKDGELHHHSPVPPFASPTIRLAHWQLMKPQWVILVLVQPQLGHLSNEKKTGLVSLYRG